MESVETKKDYIFCIVRELHKEATTKNFIFNPFVEGEKTVVRFFQPYVKV